MRIRLKNIGIIDDSTIDIPGLTVITGLNASGKTTAGKVLYSLYDAVENVEGKMLNKKGQLARLSLEKLLAEPVFADIKELCRGEPFAYFLESGVPFFISYGQIDEYVDSLSEEAELFDLEGFLLKMKSVLPAGDCEEKSAEYRKFFAELKTRLYGIKAASAPEKNTTGFAEDEIRGKLEREFAGQIQPLTSPSAKSAIQVTEDGKTVFDITIESCEYTYVYDKEGNDVENIFLLDDAEDLENAGTITYSLPSAADNWLAGNRKDEIFDVLKSRSVLTHSEKNRIYLSLLDNEIFLTAAKPDAACKDALEKLSSLIPGDFVEKDKKMFYRLDGYELNVRNLSCGSKVLSALKILINLGLIKKGTVLILDEPEVHLNPDWQNKYAEILTCLSAGGVRILLTTHSPNFLLALETYTKIHGTEGGFRVYVTERDEKTKLTNLKDVSESLEDAYEILARPYMEMDELRYSLGEDE
ncbi:MAG: AAA family ATPase [Clostridia bacterium]|nr:AAA family ATPase [Clostridia bacterium]